MSKQQYTYMFNEVDATMRNLCGGKGANLGQMTKLGLPIPEGFIVTTEACLYFYKHGQKLSKEIMEQVKESLKTLEKQTGKKFGDPNNPLLLSVRSGARVSMPGMMDTILNLGLNDIVATGLARKTNNPRFVYDSYRRFVQMYSDVVMGVGKSEFEKIIDEMKEAKGIKLDTEFSADDFKKMIKRFKAIYKEAVGKDFPENPEEQLFGAINAVFLSWNTPRAIYYRRMNDIPHEWGTAVNVQSMVFGNMGDSSGTGVAFSRNPATGDDHCYGEYLMNAQGEDVVAGIRTPEHIDHLKDYSEKLYNQLIGSMKKLETFYKDMQDIEFTIEEDKLYLLQTRSGKRTAQAAIKIAIDMHNEGLITKDEALLLLQPAQLDDLLHPHFVLEELKQAKPIGQGLPASPGAATGEVAFTVEKAIEAHNAGRKVVLVRLETSPEDIEGMDISEGFLTARGGMTSHAAVVARGMGKCCVAGCHELRFQKDYALINDVKIKEGDVISLDGSTGLIYNEAIPTEPATISGDFATIMEWATERKRLGVRANADTPKDAKQAREFGATGIGLCRTEHMFFGEERIKAIREMIIADTTKEREKALAKIQPMQEQDFEALFEAMGDYSVTIRLLDPPLHEFLPKAEKDIAALAKDLGVSLEKMKLRISELEEANPMLGHRGCRLAISYPELPIMQTRAIIEAYCAVKKRNPAYKAVPEIMIPLVGEIRELRYLKDIIKETADQVLKENKMKGEYKIGTMIEVPRAALLSDIIGAEADFFSFGTNDLTQMTFGFSRDDGADFLKNYYAKRIYLNDPFARLDQEGVGQLVKMTVEKGRKANKKLKIGICGEHGGDPSSVDFFHRAGLDYVSCSPYRVPIAILAAAQAAIKHCK